jgi:hypothetical protein
MPGPLILVEKLRTMLAARRAAGVHPELRPVIDETAVAWPFTDAAVDLSPTAPGVYLLYKDGRLIYIGAAVNGSGIRQELQGHLTGVHGACTSAATAFIYEPAADPLRLHRRYLAEHRSRYGRLPACNESGQ